MTVLAAFDANAIRPSALPARRSERCPVPDRAPRNARARAHWRYTGAARQRVADMDDRAPLRETSAHLAVRGQAIPQPVEPFGDGFAGAPASGFAPVSTLMPGKMPCFEGPDERRAVGALWRIVSSCMMTPLMKSAASAREKHFTVGAPALLGRLDAESIEAFRQVWGGFVGGEYSLSRRRPAQVRLPQGHGSSWVSFRTATANR